MTQSNAQGTNQDNRYSREQLSRLALFLTAAVYDLTAGLQESSDEILENPTGASQEQLTRHAQILAALAGASTTVGLLMGVSAEEMSTLSKEMTTKIMAQFDSLQNSTH